MTMPPQDADSDPKVKDMLDSGTRADLERWFGLPSFQELADKGIPVEDPDVAAVRERREKAIAAVDPALVEAHRRRTDAREGLIRFKSDLTLNVERPMAKLDLGMIARTVADPREIEIGQDLEEDLKECTPQAILRDLHRPELVFDKTFELVDIAAEQRLDIVAVVAAAMATNWKLPPLGELPFREAREIMEDLRRERRQPWAQLCTAQPLPNRRWVEDR